MSTHKGSEASNPLAGMDASGGTLLAAAHLWASLPEFQLSARAVAAMHDVFARMVRLVLEPQSETAWGVAWEGFAPVLLREARLGDRGAEEGILRVLRLCESHLLARQPGAREALAAALSRIPALAEALEVALPAAAHTDTESPPTVEHGSSLHLLMLWYLAVAGRTAPAQAFVTSQDLLTSAQTSVLDHELAIRIVKAVEEEPSGLQELWPSLLLSLTDEKAAIADARLRAAVACTLASHAPSHAVPDLIRQLDSNDPAPHVAELLRVLGALLTAQDAFTANVMELIGRYLHSASPSTQVAALNILAHPELHSAPRDVKEKVVSIATSAFEVRSTRTAAMRAVRHLRDRDLAKQTVVGLVDIQHVGLAQTVAVETISELCARHRVPRKVWDTLTYYATTRDGVARSLREQAFRILARLSEQHPLPERTQQALARCGADRQHSTWISAAARELLASTKNDQSESPRPWRPPRPPVADGSDRQGGDLESRSHEWEHSHRSHTSFASLPDDALKSIRRFLNRETSSDVALPRPRFPGSDEHEHLLDSLRTAIRSTSSTDLHEVLHAYGYANLMYEGKWRESGEPLVAHPVAVATELATLGLGTETIVAALLYSTVADTQATLQDVREGFGDEVARLIDGVTELDRIRVGSRQQQQVETLRKMILAMVKDIRVLVIKLADRLHIMETIGHLPREAQKRIATETLDVYAPLAHQLGMQSFKQRLEDLGFKALHPKRYEEIVAMVEERSPEREAHIDETSRAIEALLRELKIPGEVTGRAKHYYSTYETMVLRGTKFDEIHDLVSVRVIVSNVRDCYAMVGTLHATWRPVPGRFKDYIAMPKINLYQSLHTSVIGLRGRPLEVQIRTREMHLTAEFGVARHWRDKWTSNYGLGAFPDRSLIEQRREWLESVEETEGISDWLLRWASQDPRDDLESYEIDLYPHEVFVFTPRGDLMSLPAGATPIDFAYAVHTEVGHRTVGARVDGCPVPLDHKLSNGDSVEILTSEAEDAGPSRAWLQIAVSRRARSSIRAYFNRQRRDSVHRTGCSEVGD